MRLCVRSHRMETAAIALPEHLPKNLVLDGQTSLWTQDYLYDSITPPCVSLNVMILPRRPARAEKHPLRTAGLQGMQAGSNHLAGDMCPSAQPQHWIPQESGSQTRALNILEHELTP